MKNSELPADAATAPALLKSVSELAEASMASLVATYNSLTGKSITKFSALEVGRRRVEMALLSAKSADEQTGVPAGSSGQPLARAEIVAKARAKGMPVPPGPDEDAEAERLLAELPENSMAKQLALAAKNAKPIPPRERRAAGQHAPRVQLMAVKATFAGTSKPQPGSVRCNVLVFIQGHKDRVTKTLPKGAVTLAEIDAHMEISSKGYVQKLIEVKHLEPVDLVKAE